PSDLEERHIVCYRTQLNMTRDALEQNEIQERLNLDCEPLCELIEPTRNRLFASADAEEPFASIEAHPIEKQHDYNLLLIFHEPAARHTPAQRCRARTRASRIQ